jgi:hypothetical protein
MTETLLEKTCIPCRGGILPLTREDAESLLAQAPAGRLLRCKGETGDAARLDAVMCSSCRSGHPLTSALGQKRKWRHLRVMSALSPTTDITRGEWEVRFVPLTDIPALTKR